MVKMFAVDNFLGHWDGYSGPIINNYFLRSNSKSVFTFLPWGADQTFGENRQTPELLDTYTFAMDKPDVGYPWIKLTHKTETLERGLLFRKCLAYKPCQTLYLQQLKAASAKATAIKLPNLMANAGKVVDFLYSQLTGGGLPSPSDKAAYVDLILNKTYSIEGLAVAAAELSLNPVEASLVGLATSGLPFILPS
jgi:hypothetical protein